MKVTLKDVAAAANVGVSTASYVLNGTGLHKVGSETRERIFAAAAKLNYTPNGIARGLRSGKSYLIGVLLPGIDYSFMPEIIAGIDRELARHGYNMLLGTFNTPEEIQQKLQMLQQKQVDGIITKLWNGTHLESALTGCRNSHLPCVLVTMPDTAGFPGVQVDPEQLSNMAWEHLYRHNHRKIATVIRNTASIWQDFFIKSVSCRQDAEIIKFFCDSPGWMDELFTRRNEFSAVAACDQEAVKIIHEAALHNIKIPEEFSVLGVDGQPMGEYTTPGLTSIAQPRSEQGAEAARLLIGWINSGCQPEGVKLAPALCLRQSTGFNRTVNRE